MSNIRIVTDSTADLTPELVERYGIRVVPLEVLAEGKAYKDKIDITNEEYYEILRSAAVLPTTSQPSPAVFAQTYRELAAEGADFQQCRRAHRHPAFPAPAHSALYPAGCRYHGQRRH